MSQRRMYCVTDISNNCVTPNELNELGEKKFKIINVMCIFHGTCILLSFVCESGIAKCLSCIMEIKSTMFLKIISMIMQTVMNQGLIFLLCYFYFYTMFNEWELLKNEELEFGHFEHVDLFDCLVLMDICAFFSTIIWLQIILICTSIT